MMNKINWAAALKSKTVVATLVGIILTIAQAKGYQLEGVSVELSDTLTLIGQSLAASLALYGRVKADGPLTK